MEQSKENFQVAAVNCQSLLKFLNKEQLPYRMTLKKYKNRFQFGFQLENKFFFGSCGDLLKSGQLKLSENQGYSFGASDFFATGIHKK